MKRSTPEQAAERILGENAVSEPPISVERLAKALGAQVAFEPFDGEISGMLIQEQTDTRPLIVVNSANAMVRQRFTVAHELGHLILHRKSVYVDRPFSVKFRDSQSSLAIDAEEIQANRFAAALLMPSEWVIRDAEELFEQRHGVAEEQIIEELARRYRVSQQAMEYRLANLGIWAPL